MALNIPILPPPLHPAAEDPSGKHDNSRGQNLPPQPVRPGRRSRPWVNRLHSNNIIYVKGRSKRQEGNCDKEYHTAKAYTDKRIRLIRRKNKSYAAARRCHHTELQSNHQQIKHWACIRSRIIYRTRSGWADGNTHPPGCQAINAKAGKTAEKALPFRRYKSSDGHEIICGRSNIQNDKLTFTVASRKTDWWFHVKGLPGTHVILKPFADEDMPSDSSILEAASLAAFFSKSIMKNFI